MDTSQKLAAAIYSDNLALCQKHTNKIIELLHQLQHESTNAVWDDVSAASVLVIELSEIVNKLSKREQHETKTS